MRTSIGLVAAGLLTLSPAFASYTVTVLTDPAQIAAFQAGATIQTFESVSGVPGVNITNFNNGQAVGASGQNLLQTWGGGSGFITTSGGAAPAGLFNLTGGLTGASSGTHVLAALDSEQASCFDSSKGCFMAFELLFTQPVQKVGFYMNAGASTIAGEGDSAVTVNTDPPVSIQRSDAMQLFAQTNISAGFIAITSSAADINGISIIPRGAPMFIDDVTWARSTSTTGDTSTPEPATFALTGVAFALAALRMRKR